ncbi:nitroimidazol reductase NimA-like FMN-containing flavoprotein (pyridoxamine 5'-phosphate oxidase superfamily) [Sinobacterium caligoides]|uniref:Nitroimidazol reductase NimA-like FMN-containing flavoprotein (Pyridoxamine 5'-phosphate oxidase superfamily) n=1 Tax=Sinobacterium caligoides TaxID=933926 RepID=A0A3N2DZZ8_9GAMM|nr:pyridoxamine 5'-phosphate oxidase family protein [Sinobacterium caligoides]ROS05232.1 nitroimidazol reductase NimA-like FMN-containing flavoprotein (pyridoxamine 5'-phosphate oxidase superfamily) [Sinobacterium caligoides]
MAAPKNSPQTIDQLARSPHSTIKRGVGRASYDKALVLQLVDDLKLGHMGFVLDGRPVIIPMTIWRVDEALYFHVANKSRLQKMLEQGDEFCLSIAECSEWVMAKSAYHHSANFRSAVLYCSGKRITDPQQFDRVFSLLINDLEEGRWDHVRPPSAQERKGTALMQLQINEGSYKSRTGGPNENAADLTLPVWHGVKPTCPFHQG